MAQQIIPFELNIFIENAIEDLNLTKKQKTHIRKYVAKKYTERGMVIPLVGNKYNHCKCRNWQRCDKHNVCMCFATTKCVSQCDACENALSAGTERRNNILNNIRQNILEDVQKAIDEQ